MEIFTSIVGIIGAITLTTAYLLLQFKHITSDTKTYDYLNLAGSSMILYSLFYDWNTGAALIEIAWIIISFFTIINSKRKKKLEKIGNLNAQYEHLNDNHFLKYFNNYDINYNVGEEFEKIFNFNLAASSQIPFFVRLFENPEYSWFLPSIFKGRVGLKQHDFIHLLLSRGFNIVDEIAVVGVSMGSTKGMNSFNTFIFYMAQWLFYDKYFRFPLKYYPIFAAYVKLGHGMKKNLSKVKVEKWSDYEMQDLRKEFGLFKEDLIEIWKIEVLEFGVNGRMLDGLTINTKELTVLEEHTDEIVIYSPNLKNDLLEPSIISAVASNLKNGIKYKYILPSSTINTERKKQLLELHENNSNLSVIIIDKKDYAGKYDISKEYVFYDNILYLTEDKDGLFTIHSL